VYSFLLDTILIVRFSFQISLVSPVEIGEQVISPASTRDLTQNNLANQEVKSSFLRRNNDRFSAVDETDNFVGEESIGPPRRLEQTRMKQMSRDEELEASENTLDSPPHLSPSPSDKNLPIRKGVLRVRITEFLNPSNKDADGDCCMEFKDAPTCRGHCRLFFR